MSNESSKWDFVRRALALVISITALVVVPILLAWLFWLNRFDPLFSQLLMKDFVVLVGLPLSALTAFVVVTFFRQPEKPMVIKFPGIELSGSSGEVLMWLAIFFTVAFLIHRYWIEFDLQLPHV